VYKHGKKYSYFYVTSKGVTGWTWHKYLKAGSYKALAKKSTVAKTPTKNKTVNPDETYNPTTLANDVISQINTARSKFTVTHTGALVHDEALTQVGNVRAKQLVNNFAHEDENGNTYVEPLAKQYGIWDSYYGTEDIGIDSFDTSNQKTANAIIARVKQSEDHWSNLTNAGFTKIGVGQYKAPDGTLYLALELGY
ncbi:CAP domain-containing protein, partial [Lactiplantibacillus garii]